MILQKLAFPDSNICEETELYYRLNDKAHLNDDSNSLLFEKNGWVRFNTYFNSFSLNKWNAYTKLKELVVHIKCRGKFVISFQKSFIKDNVLIDEHLFSEAFDGEYRRIIPTDIAGVLSFTLDCISDEGELLYGAYEADVDESELNKVKISMGICTFKREQYIIANLEQIKNKILVNKESPLFNKLEVFVSDNANTLPLDAGNEHIRILYNPNTGGAGGFTRCMMETLKVKDELGITHMLLCDDDIRLDPASVEKLGVFLMFVDDKYKESFVGGSMFRIDEMNVQSEVANRWNWGSGTSTAYMYKKDMLRFYNVVRNEIPLKINYLSWWFCCMPMDAIDKRSLPFPFFIKRDDIEFGLRNGGHFITLNGINVWHEPFEIKRPAYLEYYYIRNQLIMESAYNRTFDLKYMIHKTRQMFIETFTRFKYIEFKFYCQGIADFLRGIDWLKNVDAVELNKKLLSQDRKFLPFEELPIPYDEEAYLNSFIYDETPKHFKIRKYTLNGWLLPAKKEPGIAQSAFPRKYPFYRRKEVLMVESFNKRGYIAKKDWKEFFANLSLCFKTEKLLKKYYVYATTEYSSRWHELVNEEAWNKYLFTERDQSLNDKFRPAKNKPVDQKLKRKLEDIYVANRNKPIIDNLVYIESRKGTDFASNIFAVAKELQDKEYKRFKIVVGITKDYKRTFLKKVRKNKLHVSYVIKDSKKFQKIMARAKYFFTDFHLYPHFAKREDQVVVSLWHGTPLKTLGRDCKAETQIAVQRIMNIADYQVYPGKFMEEKMLDVYWQNNLYCGKVLRTGYPRNALFFDEKRRAQIRKEIKAGSKQLIMYMPTFRGSAGNNKNKEQNELLLNYFKEIDQKLNDNQIFYIKLHNYNAEAIDVSQFKHIKKPPVEYDNYEFQNACDLLVTDYSSVFFDFAISRRKIVLFQYDQEEYLSDRGVCFPLSELPFPIVKTASELVDEINKPIAYNDEAFLAKYATFDNKNATKMLCEHVVLGKELPEGKEVSVKHNGLKNIYIYGGSFKNKFSAYPFWDIASKLDYDKANYFICYYDPDLWKDAYRLLPLNDKCNQIGMWSFGSYTNAEYKAHEKFLQLLPLSDKENSTLERFYDRELKKHFGYLNEPDFMVLVNCMDMNIYRLYGKYGSRRIAVLEDNYEFPVFEDGSLSPLEQIINDYGYEIVRRSEFNTYIKEHGEAK